MTTSFALGRLFFRGLRRLTESQMADTVIWQTVERDTQNNLNKKSFRIGRDDSTSICIKIRPPCDCTEGLISLPLKALGYQRSP